jgi:RNA polymerase sigma-70 factor (ECF subfamily)
MNKQEFKIKVFSLSERLYPLLYRLLGSREKVEDALQEIMMKLWLKRHKIQDHPNINAFVFLTAKNYCLDVLRKNNPKVVDSDLYMKTLQSENGHENLKAKELNEVILRIIRKLPESQSEVLILRDLDGLEFEEIASVTNLNIKHVRVLLSRARKHVRSELKSKYYYEG